MVAKSRDEELESLRRIAYLRGFSRAYMTALPTLAAVVTFIAFAYGTDQPITAATLFSALVAFDQLRFPLMCTSPKSRHRAHPIAMHSQM